MSSPLFPSTGGKPKFNPNAPYKVADGDPVPKQKKPAFNPNKKFDVVEAVPVQQAAQPVFQVQIQEPTFRGGATGTLTQESAPNEPVNIKKEEVAYVPDQRTIEVEKMRGKAQEAHKKIHSELLANDDQYEKLIRESRRDEYTVDQLRADYKSMGQILAPQDEKRILQRERQRRYEMPVTPEDISDAKTGTVIDEKGARKFLKNLKKPEAMASSYMVDKFNEIAKDPEATERIGKIKGVEKEIKAGRVIYDPETGQAFRPVGLIGSAVEAVKQKNQLYADRDFLKNTENDSAILSEYKARKKDQQDDPIVIPKGKASEIVGGLAGTPLKIYAAGALGGLAGPQAGMTAAAIVGGREMAKLEYPATFWRTLDELISQGVPEFEAVQKARFQADQASEVAAITGGVTGLVGAKIGFGATPKINLSNGFKSAAFNLLKQNGYEIGRAGLEGIATGGVGVAGEMYKNKLAQDAGIKRDIDEGTAQVFEQNLLTTVALAAAIKAFRGVTAPKARQLMHGLSKLPNEQISEMLMEKVNAGEITQQAADETIQRVNEYKEKDAQIPPSVTEEARFKIQDNIDKINELEQNKEATHSSLHDPIKEKINELKEKNLALSKEVEKSEPVDTGLTKEKEKEAKEIAEEWVAEGIFPDTFEGAVKTDPIGFWRELAQQAQNRDKDWNPLKPEDAALSEQAVRDQFGDTVVDYAVELFPAPEMNPSAVSVIRPGEIKQPETITIKPKQQESILVSDDIDKPILWSNELIGSDVLNADLPDDYVSKSGKGVKVGRQTRYDDIYDAAQDMGIISNTTKRLFEYLRGKVKATLTNKDGGPVEGMYSPKDNHILVYKKNANWVTIHEAIHAAIDKLGMRNEKEFTAKLRGVADEVKEAYNANKKQFVEKYGDDFDSTIYQIVRSGNEEEVVTYFLTNEKFREFANEIGVADKIHNIIPKEIRPEVQPEIVTIKPKENAVSVEKPDAVDVREPAQDGQGVGQGDAQPERVAGEEITIQESAPASQEGLGGARMVGITHKQMDDIAREFGFDTYEKSPERIAEWDEQAAKRIENDPNAISSLFNKLRNGQSPDPVETRMMVQYMGDLMGKIDVNPTDQELLTQLKRTKDLFNVAGRIQGQQLVARKGFVGAEDRLGDFLVKDMEANRAPLTDEQTKQAIKEYDEIKKVKDELDAKVAKLEADNAKLKAQKELEKIAKLPKKSDKRDFKAERAQVLNDIKKKWDESKGQLSVALVPYADRLVKIAPDAAKLVKLLVEEGIEKLPDVIKAAHDHLKLFIPEITEKDVHDLIAGEYNKPKATKNDLSEKLYDLRTEAKLINRLEALENGEEPKNEKQRVKRSREIEELREKIKEHDLTRLAAHKKRIEGQIEKVQEQLRTGDFSDQKKADVKLDHEAITLKDRLTKLKQEREKRLAQLEYENRTTTQKIKDVASEIAGVPRTLMASADFSAPLRQGLVATVSHPTIAAKSIPEMFKQAFSRKEFDRWLVDLKESPEYKLMEDSGLYVADPNDLRLQAKEEQFMSNLGEKIPLIGRIVKGSERGYVAYLNKMRTDLFNQGAEVFADQGRTFENSPELYKGLATFINNATGRGGLGPLEKSAQVLNTAFFSPRLIASRLNLINPVFYTKLPKEVRIMALKDMGKVMLFGATVLGLAKAAGAEVEGDARSSDFGKIKVGNTRWDIWGGFQQYARLFWQLRTGETKSSSSGKIYKLDGESFPYKTRLDQLASFFRGKLAPVPGTIVDVLAGKNMVGEEFDIQKKAADLFIPMIAQDIAEAWKEQGPKSILTVGIPSAFGIGTTTYEAKPPKSKTKNTVHKNPRGKSKTNPHKNKIR